MTDRNAIIDEAADLIEAKALAWDESAKMMPQDAELKNEIGRVTRFQIADALRAAAYDLQTLKE